MNKPLTMVVKETKNKMIDVCNESGLSPVILDMIMQGISIDIHSLAEKQTLEEEKTYIKMVEEETSKEIVEDDKDMEITNDDAESEGEVS